MTATALFTPTVTVALRKTRIFGGSEPIRVYADDSDASGIVLCRAHREAFFAANLGACSDGVRGQRCEQCAGHMPAETVRTQSGRE